MKHPTHRKRTVADQLPNPPTSDVVAHSDPPSSETLHVAGAADAVSAIIPSDANFRWAIIALEEGRDEVLANWLQTAKEQPFHLARPERAVGDHIPRLYDTVVQYLKNTSRTWKQPGSPLNDPAILEAANAHANQRAGQGLSPSDIVTEFRLLRRAIWQGLRDHLVDVDSIENLVNAELLVNDAIDGAITVGLERLSARIETIREDFLVATVHDIRQPITTIKGLVQLSNRYLARSEPEIERTQLSLNGIETQVDQMNQTIDLLIEVSRAALGHLSLEYSLVDLAVLIPEVVEQNSMPQLREVRMVLPAIGTSAGYWDANRLRQVISNILSNAVKYSPSGDPIEIAVQATAELVNVSIRDFGMGLKTEELPKIFDRYYRTMGAMDGDMEGSGIGLYLCARIIEGHGGTIWAESDGPERGTTIRFNLPRRPPDQPTGNES